MKSFGLAICIACFVVVALSEKLRYDNYRVYSLDVANEHQLKVLNGLEAYPDGIVFLEPPTVVGQIAELLVPPQNFTDVAGLFETFDIQNRIKTSNFQE